MYDNISLNSSKMTNFSDKRCRENENKHFCSKNFFYENRTFYEIMQKNMVQPYKTQMIMYNTAHELCMLDN